MLPDLNKIHKQREAKFSITFRNWLKDNPRSSCTFEMKDTRGEDSLPFSEVKDAQIDFGMAIKSSTGVLMRLEPIVEGMPDYVYYRNSPAYIVIKYPKCFVLIDVETLKLEKKRSKRRSLTSSRAKEISVLTVE